MTRSIHQFKKYEMIISIFIISYMRRYRKKNIRQFFDKRDSSQGPADPRKEFALPYPLNPKIKIWILICCPISFPTEKSNKLLSDPVRNSHDPLCFTKHWYYKQKFDADHS